MTIFVAIFMQKYLHEIKKKVNVQIEDAFNHITVMKALLVLNCWSFSFEISRNQYLCKLCAVLEFTHYNCRGRKQ